MSVSDRDLDSLLASMLPKMWSFAFRLTRDERLAEQLVLRACRYWLDHACHASQSKSPLVQMLSAIQTIWLAEENPHDDQMMSEPRHYLHFDAKPVDRSDNRTHETQRRSPDPIMAVAKLPKLLRIVMILIHAEGLSHSEAAEAVGVHVSHVRRLIRQAQLTVAYGVVR